MDPILLFLKSRRETPQWSVPGCFPWATSESTPQGTEMLLNYLACEINGEFLAVRSTWPFYQDATARLIKCPLSGELYQSCFQVSRECEKVLLLSEASSRRAHHAILRPTAQVWSKLCPLGLSSLASLWVLYIERCGSVTPGRRRDHDALKRPWCLAGEKGGGDGLMLVVFQLLKCHYGKSTPTGYPKPSAQTWKHTYK